MDQDLDRGERLPRGLHPRRDRVGGEEPLQAVGQRVDAAKVLGDNTERLVRVDGVVERVRLLGQAPLGSPAISTWIVAASASARATSACASRCVSAIPLGAGPVP